MSQQQFKSKMRSFWPNTHGNDSHDTPNMNPNDLFPPSHPNHEKSKISYQQTQKCSYALTLMRSQKSSN